MTQGKEIPDGSVVMGSPARVVRATTAEEREHSIANARMYAKEAQRYRAEEEQTGRSHF